MKRARRGVLESTGGCGGRLEVVVAERSESPEITPVDVRRKDKKVLVVAAR